MTILLKAITTLLKVMTGLLKETRDQSVQVTTLTDPMVADPTSTPVLKETRDKSVQVTLTDPMDANRSIKDKDQMSPRSREGSLSGISPTLATTQQDLPLSRPSESTLVTSFTGNLPERSPLGPDPLPSPRFRSPGGSSIIFEPTPTYVPHHLLPSSVPRTSPSDTASPPPPISPGDTPADFVRRETDAALVRFLEGCLAEEEQSQSQSPP